MSISLKVSEVLTCLCLFLTGKVKTEKALKGPPMGHQHLSDRICQRTIWTQTAKSEKLKKENQKRLAPASGQILK